MSTLLTVSGVARKLGIPETTVRWLEKQGKLAAVRDSSNRRLFEQAAVERFSKERAKGRAHNAGE